MSRLRHAEGQFRDFYVYRPLTRFGRTNLNEGPVTCYKKTKESLGLIPRAEFRQGTLTCAFFNQAMGSLGEIRLSNLVEGPYA